jgi:hypothetical protein
MSMGFYEKYKHLFEADKAAGSLFRGFNDKVDLKDDCLGGEGRTEDC